MSRRLWRYFKPERFFDLLDSSAVYFASVRQFEDPFEGAIAIDPPESFMAQDIQAGANRGVYEELRRLTKVSCWNIGEHESEAMWKLYAGERKGIAIVTTLARVAAALRPFRLAPTYGEEEPWWGDVRYVDLTQQTLHLGDIERFFYKHMAFETEREFRIAIPLTTAEEFAVPVPEFGIKVPVSIDTLIEKIILGPELLELERDRLISACARAGIEDRVATSTLLWRPRYIPFRVSAR